MVLDDVLNFECRRTKTGVAHHVLTVDDELDLGGRSHQTEGGGVRGGGRQGGDRRRGGREEGKGGRGREGGKLLHKYKATSSCNSVYKMYW